MLRVVGLAVALALAGGQLATAATAQIPADAGFGQPQPEAVGGSAAIAGAGPPRSGSEPAPESPDGGGPASTPVRFEANHGQYPAEVRFVARTAGYTLSLTEEGATFHLPPEQQAKASGADETVTLRFAGTAAGAPAAVEGVGQLPGRTHYLTEGDSPTKVTAFGRVRYQGMWPGIDVVFYTTDEGEIEYDFEVAPGADPDTISLSVDGADEVRLTDDGDLVIDTAAGPLRQSSPQLHQPTSTGEEPVVAGRFTLVGAQVGFHVGPYDPTRALVIDPVVSYATPAVGGEHVAVHDGHTYLAYTTDWSAVATSDGVVQPDSGNEDCSYCHDVVVVKLAADGSHVRWATYLGGSRHEELGDVAVTPEGRVVVAGATASEDFPTTDSAYQAEPAGAVSGHTQKDAFVTVLTSDGTGLVYASLLGGSDPLADAHFALEGGDDVALGLALAQSTDGLRIHLAGETNSVDFPATIGSHDELCGSAGSCDRRDYLPRRDGFVATFDPGRVGDDSLVWASYLGGERADTARDVAAGPDGEVYVVGDTRSRDFPTTDRAFDGQGGCPVASRHSVPGVRGLLEPVRTGCHFWDGFVAVMNGTGEDLKYATYIGTNPQEPVYTGDHRVPGDESASYKERMTAVAVDDGGWAHVLGTTTGGEDFAEAVTSQGALQSSVPSAEDEESGFVVGLDPASGGGASRVYGTFLPAGDSTPHDLAVADEGVYVTGATSSEEFPATDEAVQDHLAGDKDAFVFRMARDGTSLEWATYLGGPATDEHDGIDRGKGLAVAGPGPDVYVTGVTAGFGATPGAFTGDGFGRHGVSGARFVAGLVPGDGTGEGVGAPQPEPGPLPLTLTGLTPRGGPPVGDTDVTLTGTGLARVTQVHFGDTTLPCGPDGDQGCRGVNDTTLRVAAPGHEPGEVDVTVTDGTTTTSPVSFLYALGAWEPVTDFPLENSEVATVTGLADGRVLITPEGTANGGQAVVYDPKIDTWAFAGTLNIPRRGHTATLLAAPECGGEDEPTWCGKVLIAGGRRPGVHPSTRGAGLVGRAELYDPQADEGHAWTTSEAEMVDPVHDHTATLLQHGGVLVVGGCPHGDSTCVHGDRVQTPHAEIYNPGADEWRLTRQQPSHGRVKHAAARLPDGRVLAVSGLENGGSCQGTCPRPPPSKAPAEMYHSSTGRWTEAPVDPPEEMAVQRLGHDVAWLRSGGALCGARCGKLLVAGGASQSQAESPELYDPDPPTENDTWNPAGTPQDIAQTVVGLPDGRGLAVGGAVELYEPTRDSGDGGDEGAWTLGAPPPGGNRNPADAVVLSGNPASRGFAADAGVCGPHCGKVFTVTEEGAKLFTPPPTVTGVTPATGPATGGSEVTVTGYGFTHGLTEVSFGAHTIQCSTSPACRVDSYGQLTVTDLPAHPPGGPVRVTVTNQAGSSRPGQGPVFTYQGAPGAVDDLAAEGVAVDTVAVSWQAVADGAGGVATDYVVKQAGEPITSEAEFAAARSVCGGQPCHPQPTLSQVGQSARVRVGNLTPGTTYHYAIRAVGEDGQTGPISESVSATTLADDTSGAGDGADGDEGTGGDGSDGDGTSGGADDPQEGGSSPALEGGTRPSEQTPTDDGTGADGSDEGPARASRTGCPEAVVPGAGFGDTAGSVHQAMIDCLAWYGLTLGRGDLDGDGQPDYTPGQPVTRAQMATFLTRLAVEAGVALPDQPNDAFGDDNGGVHEPAINQLAALGLVKGTGPGRYSPDAIVSRAQMASFLMRLHEHAIGARPAEAGDVFADDDGSVHEANINALAALGVTQGRSDTEYAPRAPVSRGQMASFLARQLGVLVEAGAAYQGGAHVTLAATQATPGGELAGQVSSNKPVESLVARGCGLADQPVQVDAQGRFAVAIPAGQPAGECQLDLAVTTVRPGQGGFGQTAPYRFAVIVGRPEGGS